ncbi:FAD-dependent oxidoreductase [Fundidesulfovibrio terrae]|uniref:FAD-dependent oxidoreductase n=1 Tax=Fundidesulfovibrio terrae TaxID=2922866 RepID=UPI001FB02D1D|nr:FAD-dependent oxidoreductase [Fundidesulfovibrio terrae]
MSEKAKEHQWYLPEKSREQLRELFKELVHPVNLHLFTLKGTNDLFNEFLSRFVDDLAFLEPRIKVHRHTVGDDASRSHKVTYSPTVLVEPERYHIRFVGAPMGEEGRSFLEALLLTSKRASGLSDESKSVLETLEEEREVKVFVSPTCPYCPAQAVNAFRAAVERPDKVRAWCVEIGQMHELADRYGVGSVPQTNFNEKLNILGLEPELRFVGELVLLKDMQAMLEAPRHKPGETVEVDCLILGAGPAGLTAGIYAGRAGLKTIILEKATIGGQVALTPVVENYPGFANIPGITLMEVMAAQARQYCEIIQEEPVSLSATKDAIEARTASLAVKAKALLITTGATWKKLDAPGEAEYFGHGVNYCATCDGYLYKGRTVLVVGGGNTALTDALYLKNLGVDVSIVHRRGEFRAERYLSDTVGREKIPTYMNSVVEAILGDVKVNAVALRDTVTGGTKKVKTDGVFVAIGETPNSEPAARLGCRLTEEGNIVVDSRMRTNVPRVYAAGDVTGGVRQIITAVGQGGTAALSIFEDLAASEHS